jgi:hypothetical protein
MNNTSSAIVKLIGRQYNQSNSELFDNDQFREQLLELSDCVAFGCLTQPPSTQWAEGINSRCYHAMQLASLRGVPRKWLGAAGDSPFCGQ